MVSSVNVTAICVSRAVQQPDDMQGRTQGKFIAHEFKQNAHVHFYIEIYFSLIPPWTKNIVPCVNRVLGTELSFDSAPCISYLSQHVPHDLKIIFFDLEIPVKRCFLFLIGLEYHR